MKCCSCFCFVFFSQKTAYEMRISDWSSDVCSSDLPGGHVRSARRQGEGHRISGAHQGRCAGFGRGDCQCAQPPVDRRDPRPRASVGRRRDHRERCDAGGGDGGTDHRSEEHTSELPSLMRISYAVLCLKKKKTKTCQTGVKNVIPRAST